MKKLLKIFIASSILTACNGNKSTLDTNKDVMVTDTSKMYKSNVLTDTGSVIQTSPLPANSNTKPTTTTTKTVTTVTTTTSNGAATTTNTGKSNSTTSSGNTSNGSTSNNNTATNTTASKPAKKKGWSHAATDATVGGMGGAVAGAIISKKHGKGAIIGGIAGAAGGYILGKHKDKKEGR